MIIQKLPILILGMTLLDCQGTEPCDFQREFKLPDGLCCPYCPAGNFITENCSVIDRGISGIRCSNCSQCTYGRMISPCTPFSDTKCSSEGTTLAPTNSSFSSAPMPPIYLSMALYVTVPLILVFLVVAIVGRLCMTRSSANQPETEPYKFQQLA